MEKELIIKQVENYVQDCLRDHEPGHNYEHVLRVRKLALEIAKEVECDIFVIELLALLHDIEDHKFNSSHKVSDFLNTLNIDINIKEKILYILPYLSFSKYPVLPKDFPNEGKVVSDADRLDAMGAVGIARAFSYGGMKNRPFEYTINHFDEKLLQLHKYLYFKKSKEMAIERLKMLQDFYDEFIKETKL